MNADGQEVRFLQRPRIHGASRTGGASARFLRTIVDARLAERERVLREQIATTCRMVRELGG